MPWDLSYHYNDRQQLISVDGLANGTMNFSYDSRGRVVNNGRYSLTYDKANQLIQAGSHHYRYDGLGRRAQIQYSGGTRYPFYSRDGQLLSEWRNGKTTNYIHLHGQLIAKSGHIDAYAGKQHYRAFGESIEGSINDVGYTGHVADSDTGLVYMQARYYDPVIGRFYSNDPIGFRDLHSFNRYAYANNNPYKYTDPDGKDAMITFNKNGSLQIDIPTKFSGSGATPSNISAIKNAVSKTWSGTYTINGKDTQVNVAITDIDSGGPVNNITLTDGPTSDTYSNGDSFVDGSNTGEWRTDTGGITDGTVAHEAGHLMGMDDKYIGSKPLPTYENNIMGDRSGSADSRNIKEAINSDVNWKKDER